MRTQLVDGLLAALVECKAPHPPDQCAHNRVRVKNDMLRCCRLSHSTGIVPGYIQLLTSVDVVMTNTQTPRGRECIEHFLIYIISATTSIRQLTHATLIIPPNFNFSSTKTKLNISATASFRPTHATLFSILIFHPKNYINHYQHNHKYSTYARYNFQTNLFSIHMFHCCSSGRWGRLGWVNKCHPLNRGGGWLLKRGLFNRGVNI